MIKRGWGLNYRHVYHAGNFADVLKHFILVELIKSLKQKEKPFFYLDTHAGRGMYDLSSVAAMKTREADAGIKRLQSLARIPAELIDYLAVVKACQGSPADYPGSPMLVRKLMRPGDRMALTELHLQDYTSLQTLFSRDRQVLTFHQDAYQSLRALLPPTPRRGLILIDPAFEVTDEFSQIIKGLKEALLRFQNGIYAVWYPIKDRFEVTQFMRKLKALGQPLLNITLQPSANIETDRLNESGVVIINPPWQLEATLRKALPELLKALSPDGGGQFSVSF
jgi:23S rRNA (adenine2030-N6)-methyltransferase